MKTIAARHRFCATCSRQHRGGRDRQHPDGEACRTPNTSRTLLPEFKAKTGIDVNIEVVNYAEMHTKLVPQLSSPKGGYSAIVVDFYWVGEFTKAGWLKPLDERIAADKVDTSRLRPER